MPKKASKKHKSKSDRLLNDKKVPCEVYSRIVGYFRPVSEWNEGKKEEFVERKPYIITNV